MAINICLSKVKNQWENLSTDEKLVMINFFSIFLPLFICAFSIGLSALYILFSKEKRDRVFHVRKFIWIPVFIALCLVTELAYRNFIGVGPTLLIFLYAVFALYSKTIMTRDLCRRLIALSSYCSIACFIVAFLQVVTANDRLRVSSTFYNPNYYAYVCETLILVLVYGFFEIRDKKWLFLVGIAADLAGIVLSGCRSAWPAVFIGVIVLLFCLKKYRHLAAFLIVMAGLGAVILVDPKLIIPRYGDYAREERIRERIWMTAFHGFLKYPLFGKGFFTYMSISTGALRKAHAHNIILDTLLNYGIVGTATISMFLVPSFARCLKNIRQNSANAFIAAMCAATLTHGMTDVTSIGTQTGCLFMILCALTFKKEAINQH